jgi:hypothetical protein
VILMNRRRGMRLLGCQQCCWLNSVPWPRQRCRNPRLDRQYYPTGL